MSRSRLFGYDLDGSPNPAFVAPNDRKLASFDVRLCPFEECSIAEFAVVALLPVLVPIHRWSIFDHYSLATCLASWYHFKWYCSLIVGVDNLFL